MAFPIQRLRRLRQHESLRRMVRETRLSPSDLIYPMFVMEGKDQRREIASMPGPWAQGTCSRQTQPCERKIGVNAPNWNQRA